MDKKVIRYCLIDSYLSGVKIHPKKVVENLGMKVYDYHGFPIGDCVYMLVSKTPLKLPDYIELSDFNFN